MNRQDLIKLLRALADDSVCSMQHAKTHVACSAPECSSHRARNLANDLEVGAHDGVLGIDDETPKYMVWATDHDAWWAPARSGYTPNYLHAGRYSGAEALDIVNGDALGEQIVVEEENAVHMAKGPRGASRIE